MARTDLLSAAIRHVRDAEFLASAPGPDRSLDQAFHLAGFAPECARKATLSRPTFDKAIGHGATPASTVSLDWALAHDPRARRYRIEDWATRYPALASWTENVRYERTGSRSDRDVQALLKEARKVVSTVTTALWMDGQLDAHFMKELGEW